jgi:hypothetical protein
MEGSKASNRGFRVESNLGVDTNDGAIGSLGERVDLNHGAVRLDECLVQGLDVLGCL